MKVGDHGPDELYNKFTVVKTKHVGTQIYPMNCKTFSVENELSGKDEFLFVLRPETNDLAAIMALDVYAGYCEDTYPELAKQIWEQLRRIRRDFPEGNPALREK